MTVDDSREFTIQLSGVPLSWWERLKAWWNSLETWQKAAVIGTGGAGAVVAGYAGTKKKVKKP